MRASNRRWLLGEERNLQLFSNKDICLVHICCPKVRVADLRDSGVIAKDLLSCLIILGQVFMLCGFIPLSQSCFLMTA